MHIDIFNRSFKALLACSMFIAGFQCNLTVYWQFLCNGWEQASVRNKITSGGAKCLITLLSVCCMLMPVKLKLWAIWLAYFATLCVCYVSVIPPTSCLNSSTPWALMGTSRTSNFSLQSHYFIQCKGHGNEENNRQSYFLSLIETNSRDKNLMRTVYGKIHFGTVKPPW